MAMSLQTSRVPQILPLETRTMHCLKHAIKSRYFKPQLGTSYGRKADHPRNKSSSAIRRTARPAMVNKKASCCLRSSRDSSSTKCCTSSSTQRQIQDTPIRGTAWSSGPDRQNTSGGLWTLCRSGYWNTHRVSWSTTAFNLFTCSGLQVSGSCLLIVCT